MAKRPLYILQCFTGWSLGVKRWWSSFLSVSLVFVSLYSFPAESTTQNQDSKKPSAHIKAASRWYIVCFSPKTDTSSSPQSTYNTLHGIAPLYLRSLLKERTTAYNLRGTLKVDLPRVTTTSYGLQSFRYAAPQVWNKLPDNIRTSESLIAFKRTIHNISVDFFFKRRLIIRTCVAILYFHTVSNSLQFWNIIILGDTSSLKLF